MTDLIDEEKTLAPSSLGYLLINRNYMSKIYLDELGLREIGVIEFKLKIPFVNAWFYVIRFY